MQSAEVEIISWDMDSPLTARAIALQLLTDGEGFGLDLIERARAKTGGAVVPKQGSLYPALAALKDDGLAVVVVREEPRQGRPARIYALTAEGRKMAEAQRAAVLALFDKEATQGMGGGWL